MQKMELARLEHLESPCFSGRWERARNREISRFSGLARVSERGKYVFSFFRLLFSLPFCLYFPPPHLSVFRTRVRRRRRFMRVRFVRFRGYWFLRRALLDSGACRREKERIYCYSRRVRRQRRTVHFSYFLCFARAFRLDPRRENRQYTWSSEQEDMWCWRLENIAEKGFYCLPRPVVAREYAYDVIFLQHWGNTEDAHIPPSSSSSHRGPLGSGSFVRSGSGHCILAAAAAGKEGNLSASPPSPRIITRERPRSTYSHRVCFRPQIQRNLDKTFPPLHVFPCCGKQGLHSVVSGNFGAEAGRLLAGREK